MLMFVLRSKTRFFRHDLYVLSHALLLPNFPILLVRLRNMKCVMSMQINKGNTLLMTWKSDHCIALNTFSTRSRSLDQRPFWLSFDLVVLVESRRCGFFGKCCLTSLEDPGIDVELPLALLLWLVIWI